MNGEKINTLSIKTPEGIIFSLQLAGPVSRFLAWGIDLAVISAASTVIGTFLNAIRIVSTDVATALTLISFFVISIGYGMAGEWFWKGQTIGKRVLRLRVMDVQGLHLQFSQIAMRNLMRFVDSLPLFYFTGGIACFLSRRSQRLGDLAANTIVIRMPDISDPDLEQIKAGKYNSFFNHPHLCVRLRQKVSPAEAMLALQAILRRNDLDPSSRIALFHYMALHFAEIVKFPEETVYGITDEQYVRNIVEVLYSKSNKKDKIYPPHPNPLPPGERE